MRLAVRQPGAGAMRNPARAWIALLLAAGVILSLASCATPRARTDEDALVQAAGREPRAALYEPGALYLEYEADGKPAYLVARWPAQAGDGEDATHRVARLDVGMLAAEAPEAPQRARRPVQRMRVADWNALVESVLLGLAPASGDEATLIAVQGRDFVIHRDAAGALVVAPHISKPGERRVTRFVDEREFSLQAMAELRTRLERANAAAAAPSLLLYPVGDVAATGSYVFFDLEVGRSVFIVAAAAPADPRGEPALGFALRMTDALLLRSHLIEPLMRPVTTLVRLMKAIVHTVMAWWPEDVSEAPRKVPPLADRPGMDLQAWEQRLDELVTARALPGRMQPLIDGEAFFGALVQAIQDARESIDVRMYIFDTDAYALSIADLLKARSRELRVRVLIDHVGSLAAGMVVPASQAGQAFAVATDRPASIVEYLRADSAIEVRTSANPWLTSDHVKVIVIDGTLAYTGGMNIGYEYRYDWHDLMLEVRGPIVERLAEDFERQWAYTGFLGDLAYFFRVLRGAGDDAHGAEDPANMPIRPLYTGIVGTEILNAQLEAIERAQRYVWVEQAYVSDDAIIAALARARRRGVDVRVVLPTRNDSGFMGSANLVAANILMASGVRVYAFPGMTHVKAAIVDGWACLGSANFDKLSLRVNLETNLATSDARFVEQLERALFERDFARSRELVEPYSLGWTTYIASFIADQL